MMKKVLWSLAVSVVILLVFITLSGCKGPTGPTGPKGDPGQNGTNGSNGTNAGFVYFEGFKDSLRCATCHTPDLDTTNFIAARELQWENSGHKSMGDYDENRGLCAGCHTSEGFILRMNGKTVSDQLNPTPVGCFACHSPHMRGDFSLRTTTSPTLLSNIAGVTDATFNYGKGNLCTQCHQPRPLTPTATSQILDANKMASTDTIQIGTSRWYGHYGVQGQILMGNGGFEFPSLGYSFPDSYHQGSAVIQQNGCPQCHMANASPTAANAGRVGGHTMNISFTDPTTGSETFNFQACNVSGCHSSSPLTTLDYRGLQTQVQANMDTLKALLGPSSVTWGGAAGLNWLDTTAIGAKLTGNKLVIKPAYKAGALWNYLLVYHDGSLGVHNSQYALALLRASITELRKAKPR